MTRLGPWNPQSPEERLDRLESLAMIRQLPSRYALAVDSKDAETLVALFVPDVQVGHDQHGRAAAEAVVRGGVPTARRLGAFRGRPHRVVRRRRPRAASCTATTSSTTARRGTRASCSTGTRTYRADAEWCFERRRFHRWYIGDALTRPAVGLGVEGAATRSTTQLLPARSRPANAFLARGERREGLETEIAVRRVDRADRSPRDGRPVRDRARAHGVGERPLGGSTASSFQ